MSSLSPGLPTNPTVREFGERYFHEQVVSNWKDPKAIRRYLNNEILPALGSPGYFPMQKEEKIRFRTSSVVVWPVSESRAQRAR